jgi:hypothetical protein
MIPEQLAPRFRRARRFKSGAAPRSLPTLVKVSEPALPITLSIWTEDGKQQDTVLPGPGGTVRFCIGDPNGDRSATWRVWATPNTSDVYIAVRDLAGEQKFSLHESGDWRHQFASADRARAYSRESRILDQWEQPAEHDASRLTLGFSIRARRQDLADYPERGRKPKDVLWLPIAPDGKATVVHIAISRLHDVPMTLVHMAPFAAFSLADGRAVLLLVTFEDIPPTLNEQVDSAIRAVTEQIDFAVTKAPRMLIHGNNEHGRVAWDVALRPL